MRLGGTNYNLFEEICVDLDILLPFFWCRRFLKNGGDGTGRLTSTTIDALVRIDIQLLNRIKIFFALCGMDAVHRADIHAGRILYTDARLSNNVGHGKDILLLARYAYQELRSIAAKF
jgi:hypothetical protein